MLLDFPSIWGSFTARRCSMNHDGIRGDDIWEFSITDTFCLQVVNGDGIVKKLAAVLGPAEKQTGGDPICVINVKEGAPSGVIVDFDTFGPGCGLNCGPGTSELDLLPWVNLLLPVSQMVSLHASAFIWKGDGAVVTGIAGSGKTGVLLAAIHQGAEAIGDECLWLDSNSKLRGLFVEMEIRADYFREFPHLRTEVSAATRNGVLLCDFVGRVIRPILPKLARKFAGRARAHVQPHIIKRHLAPQASIDRLFVSEVHPDPAISVLPVKLKDAVPRLVKIQCAEFTRQREQYERYLDITGGRRNEWMEGLMQRLENLFNNTLRNTRIFIVERPPSVRAEDLFLAIKKTWP